MHDKLHSHYPERGWRITVASGFLGLVAFSSLFGSAVLGFKAWHAHEHANRDSRGLPFRSDVDMPKRIQLEAMVNDSVNPTLSINAQIVLNELDSTDNYKKGAEVLGGLGFLLMLGTAYSANNEAE